MRYLLPILVTTGCVIATTNVAIDQDQDGLMSTVEATMGTDPENPDSDGDLVVDGKEFEEGTNPLDPDDKPYIGGWSIDKSCRDSVEGVGNAVGDITTDFEAPNQFGEVVRLYDFCARAILITSGAFW